MIIRPAPIACIWVRGSVVWTLSLFMIAIISWSQWVVRGLSSGAIGWIGGVFIFLIPSLYIAKKMFGESQRVVFFAFQFGILIAVPLFIFSITPMILVLYFQVDYIYQVIISLGYIFCLYVVVGYDERQGVVRRKAFVYFGEEVKCMDGVHVLDRELTKEFDASENIGLSKKIEKWMAPLFFFVPLAYPLQRAVAQIGDENSILYLLALISTPLSIYVFIRMLRGFKIWILYLIDFEMENKIKVYMR